MKILRLVAFLLVSFLVFGCKKAKNNSVDNVNDESLVAVQNAMIEPIKKALPIVIDELTTLIGIDKDKDHNIITSLITYMRLKIPLNIRYYCQVLLILSVKLCLRLIVKIMKKCSS